MNGFDIRQLRVDPPVVLAPMEGVTDRSFRTLIRSLGGCGLAVTEVISSEAMTRDVRDAWRMAELDPDEHPVSIQIYGRDPARMAQAARHCQSVGADIVDINLGCPSKRVTSGCAGSALMREPDLARRIFDAVYDAIDVPMTVKMRLGWDHDCYTAPEIASAAVEAGAQMIAVHGRTKSDGYRNHSRWEMVREVVEAVPVPVLVNGDIVDPASARAALAASGAAGVMIGRGVMADPWTLARVSADLRGAPFVDPTPDERCAVLLGYLDRIEVDAALLRRRLHGKIRQSLVYFTHGLWGAARLRNQMQAIESVEEARRAVVAFFEQVRERASDAEELSCAG